MRRLIRKNDLICKNIDISFQIYFYIIFFKMKINVCWKISYIKNIGGTRMISKRKYIGPFFSVVCLFIGLFGYTTTTYAQEENPMGFSVETIMPANQIDQNKTYFYVQTSPGEELTLKVKVTGTSEEPVKVKASLANAITTSGGSVSYETGLEKDPTLKDSIEEIAKLSEEEFEIKLGEEKIVEITVKLPESHYEGVKMGAVYFSRVMDKDQDKAINSDYSYRIGLLLSETDGLYSDSKTLNLLEAKPEMNRKQKSVGLLLQNQDPKTIADFYIDATIVDEKSGSVVKKQKLSSGMMAPNSQFTFPVYWGVTPMKPGKYIAKVSAKSRYDSWELEKKFEITDEQAKKMNEETVFKLTLPTWAYVSTVLLGIATIGLTLGLTLRSKKWKSEILRKRKVKKKNATKKRPRTKERGQGEKSKMKKG